MMQTTEKEHLCSKCHNNHWKVSRRGTSILIMKCLECGARDLGLINWE